MKKLLFAIVLSFIVSVVQASVYYVSTSGNDSNNGTSTSTAWQTLAKINSKTFVAGDQILFQKGNTFYGSITINQSGTSSSKITLGAYGTGANPIITGFTTVSAWTNLGSNIWESASAVSTLSTCNMVTVDGVNTAMGRTPNVNGTNGGFYTYQNRTATSVTSSSLTGTPNWTGAEVIIRAGHYNFDRCPITSQSGSVLSFANMPPGASASYGLFIQNDSRTLDQQNEWYFSPSTHNIKVYSTSQPTNVKVASVVNLLTINGSYVTINGIDFTGANESSIFRNHNTNPVISYVTIQNCNFTFSGIDEIAMKVNHLTVANNSFINQNGCAMYLDYSQYLSLTNNTIQNVGMLAGMSQGWGAWAAILAAEVNVSTIEYNTIQNVRYSGITCGGTTNSDSVTVKNNFIDTFCALLDDGGAIYGATKAKILGNIVINGIGTSAGAPSLGGIYGIYLDDNSQNNEVGNNTVYNCATAGIFLHNSSNNNVHDNLCYNNGVEQLLLLHNNSGYSHTGNTFYGNILVAKTSSQWTLNIDSGYDDNLTNGTFTNNYYCRPMSESGSIRTFQPSSITGQDRSLANWQSFSGQDANSHVSPFTISDVNDFRFEYNATASIKVVDFGQNYRDIGTNSDHTALTLQPYTSMVLLKHAPYPSTNTRKSGSWNKKQIVIRGKVIKY